ncbi:hypothetical protein GCM10010446_66870 [Streptomyces enissocaesilis]|uniref:Transposase n=1 Tax=Streptomyces enissocaesilis TaxID=332589 RepID=A0ABN3XPW9_9ACTN
MGHGGIRAVARAAGVSETTVRRGLSELEAGESLVGQVRRPGAGRKRVADLDPGLRAALLGLVEPDERGDPMSPLRWTTKSPRTLAAELTRQGHRIGASVRARTGQRIGRALTVPLQPEHQRAGDGPGWLGRRVGGHPRPDEAVTALPLVRVDDLRDLPGLELVPLMKYQHSLRAHRGVAPHRSRAGTVAHREGKEAPACAGVRVLFGPGRGIKQRVVREQPQRGLAVAHLQRTDTAAAGRRRAGPAPARKRVWRLCGDHE